MLQSLNKAVSQPEFPPSAKKKYQGQRQVTTTHENSLLEPREQNNMNPRKIYQKLHHRRHLSVPEGASRLGTNLNMRAGFDNFIRETIGFRHGESRQPVILNHGLVIEPPNRDEQLKSCNIVTTEIGPQKAKLKQPRKRNIKKITLPNPPSSFLHDTAHTESLKGPNEATTIIRQEIYVNDDQTFPTPPNTAPLLSMNPFDVAPLTHPHFVNLSKLSMGTPEAENYFQTTAILSPTFAHSNTEMHQLVYDHNMQEVTEDFVEITSPILSTVPAGPSGLSTSPNELTNASSTNHDAASFSNDLIPIPSGVTQEDISMYISGPDPADGKWLCLYNECGKRFGRKENIKSHVQTHLGDRQFKCHVCKKCFVRQHDLKRHSKIHTGIKPYPCLCGNAFARHDALTRHRQRGMCIGAFEGVVKKVVKRGRPRKKPLLKDPSTVDGGSAAAVTESLLSGSDSTVSGGQPEKEQRPTSASPTPSHDAESLSNFAPEMESPGYTPPTSPSLECDPLVSQSTDLFNLENLSDEPSLHSNSFSSSTISSSSTSAAAFPGSARKTTSNYNNSEYDFSSALDMTMFTEHDDLLELTALERDPTMLSFGEDFLIKQERLDAESSFFNDQ